MTKEELDVKVSKQKRIIDDANNQICSDVKEYIKSLTYKKSSKGKKKKKKPRIRS